MLTELLISSAYAQDAAAAAPSSPLMGIMPLILIMGVFYFLLIRPQQKRLKEHQAMIADVQKNDKVVTGGGIHGKVTKLSDDGTITVEIASGVEVVVDKTTLSAVHSKKAESKDKKAA